MAAKKVRLSVEHTCQNCKKRVASTCRREIYTKDYIGPCGDSFCYASCDMSTCRPIVVDVCDTCAVKLSK